jgi:hypothetical protein
MVAAYTRRLLGHLEPDTIIGTSASAERILYLGDPLQGITRLSLQNDINGPIQSAYKDLVIHGSHTQYVHNPNALIRAYDHYQWSATSEDVANAVNILASLCTHFLVNFITSTDPAAVVTLFTTTNTRGLRLHKLDRYKLYLYSHLSEGGVTRLINAHDGIWLSLLRLLDRAENMPANIGSTRWTVMDIFDTVYQLFALVDMITAGFSLYLSGLPSLFDLSLDVPCSSPLFPTLHPRSHREYLSTHTLHSATILQLASPNYQY